MNKSRSALAFIVLMGIISLFSDLTHEGARSIVGPYLGLLGASAATIGFVSGFGELIGYAFRLATGWITDKTKHYWMMAFVGYAFNLLAIPLLALVPDGGWIWACGLLILERFGKAIRHPAKNTMVSFAASEVGPGKGFAIQEALDQLGAFLGPVLVFGIMALKGEGATRTSYALAFAFLGLMAIVTLGILIMAQRLFPHPEHFEKTPDLLNRLSFDSTFWLYMAAIGVMAAGFIDFPLIAYHLSVKSVIDPTWIPLVYALAMGVDAMSALLFGSLYDRKGIVALMIAVAISAWFSPLVFLFDQPMIILAGMVLWGIGMGAVESVLKSVVATLVPKQRRATGFGIFNTMFGVCWFLGSWTMGILYDSALMMVVGVSIGLQLSALPLLAIVHQRTLKQ
jgi:predicted MFS family arabinose efflux permease